MKKTLTGIIAVLLAVIMLPCSAFAANTFEKGNPKTFWGILYSNTADPAYFANAIYVREKDILEKGPIALAKEINTFLKSQPEGRRCINLTGSTTSLTKGLKNYFFMNEESVEYVKGNIDSLFKALKDLDTPVDYVIDDNESTILCYGIESKAIQVFKSETENVEQTIATKGHLYEDWIKEELIRIEKLPEYQNVLRPALEEAGYIFGDDYDLKYINIFPGAQEPRRTKFFESNPPEGADTAYSVFNYVLESQIFYGAYNEAVFDTIKKYYPDIKGSNYAAHTATGVVPVYNYQGSRTAPGTKGSRVGTGCSPVHYGSLKMIETNPPIGYPFDTYPNTAYNQLLIEMIKTADIVASMGDLKLMPWVGVRSWVDTVASAAYCNHYGTDYYIELILHCGLYDTDPYLIYNTEGTKQGDDFKELAKVFAQLGELVGFEDRKAIVPTVNQIPSWDQRYILSGMTANGKGVWRITPDLYTPGVSMENFVASSINGVTFKIGNQYVEFPKGSYIYTPDESVSEYGYWVITPDGTWPKEYRTTSDPLPDKAADTAPDHKPEGYLYESSNTMPDPDNYLKPVLDESLVRGGTQAPQTTPSTGDNEGEAQTDAPAATPVVPAQTLKLNPIMGAGAKTDVFTGTMPADMKGHWAQDSLANMMGIGVMQGTDIGMQPDRKINKAEFVAMLMRILGVTTTEYAGGFSDVKEDAWYADTISTAAAGGWIEADGGMLAPESDLTRAKMCAILVKALSLVAEDKGADFGDIYFLGTDIKNSVNIVSSLGLIQGYPDGTFKPNNICTRAETAVIFERILLMIPQMFGEK